MVKGIDNAFDHLELCLVFYAEESLIVKIGFYFPEINFATVFSAATFCYILFLHVANWIFRWQICYLLLLVANLPPENRICHLFKLLLGKNTATDNGGVA